MKRKFGKISFIFYILLILFLINSCELENDNNDSVEIAKDIIGTWKCKEKEINGTIELSYDVGIAIKDFDSTIIRIYNFYNIGKDYYVKGRVEGYTITLMSGYFGNGYILESGSGTISTGFKKIDLTYIVDEGDGIKKKFVATYSKP